MHRSRFPVVAAMALLWAALGGAPALGAVKTWDGGGGNFSWNNAGNWDPNGIPGANDDVIIDVPGNITVTINALSFAANSITCQETLSLQNGGTLNISAASTVKQLVLSGFITGTGDLTITGDLNWINTGMSGTGHVTIARGATLSLNSINGYALGRNLDNYGTVNWTRAGIAFSNATFVNHGQILINAVDGVGMSGSVGNNTFTNLGSFVKQGIFGMGISYSNGTTMRFDNAGTVDIQQGAFTYHEGTNSGWMNIAAGAKLTSYLSRVGDVALAASGSLTSAGEVFIEGFNGDLSVYDGSIALTGVTTFNDGEMRINGPFSAEHLTVQDTAIVHFNGQTTLDVGPYAVKSSEVYFNTPSTLVIPTTLTVTDSTIGGSSVLQIDGDLTASGTSLPSPGKLIVSPGATVLFSTGPSKTVGRPIENHGTFSLWGDIRLAGVAIDNYGELLFDSGPNSDLTIRKASGVVAVNNFGTIRKTGTGLAHLASGAESVPLNNFGEVLVQGNTFSIGGGGTNTGSIVANTPLHLAGTFTHAAGASLSGPANVTLGVGTYVFNGDMALTGMLSLNGGGVVTATMNQSYPGLQVHVNQNGTLLLNASQAWPWLNVDGTIGGPGDVSISDQLVLSGTMKGTGQTIVGPEGECFISGNPSIERALVNHGTCSVTGNGTISFKGGKFINDGILSFTPVNFRNLQGVSGVNLFENGGTLTKLGAGSLTIAAAGAPLPFKTSEGSQNHVVQGAMQIDSGGSGDGDFVVDSNASLRFGADCSCRSLLVHGGLIIANGAHLAVAGDYTHDGGVAQYGLNSIRQPAVECGGDIFINDVDLWASCFPAPPSFSTVLLVRAVKGTFDGSFFSAALSPNGLLQYDATIASWVTSKTGDLDGDGIAGAGDLFLVINAWGNCPAPPAACPGDANANGKVDIDDLFIVINNWG